MKTTAQALVAALALASLGLVFAGSPAEHPPRGPALASQEALRPPGTALPDEVLVKVRPGGALVLHLANRLIGAEEVDRLESLGVVRLRLEPGMPAELAARFYNNLPFVEYAEPNYILRAVGTPDDPLYGSNQRWYYELIEAPAAWDLGPGAQPAMVAVLDTGIDIDHPDLVSKIWLNPNEIAGNGVDDDANGCVDDVHGCNFAEPKTADIACVGRPPGPSSDVTDDDGHGTFVAGIVAAATNNGQGVAGTADGVVLMPVKVLACTGGGTAADVAAGILYAARNGARVINMSFGGHLKSDTIRDAIKAAHNDYGVVLVAASGNADTEDVTFPADLPEVIAVGASDHHKPDERARFSNWGPEVDVAAPGVDITSTVPPRVCGPIWKCISSLPYSQASGTSFAAPLVSGLAGLLLSRNPGLSNEDVRTIIRSTAQALPDGDSPNWAGSGRIRMRQALEFNLEERPVGGLSPGCNMTTLTFPTGTQSSALADAVSPPTALQAVWRLDNASRFFQAFMPQAPQASDLTSLNLLDAAFICVDAAATISMPTVVSDPASAPISVDLSAGCNAAGLTFLDGTAPSEVALAITPAGALESLWRLDNATGSFQAYVAAAPQASDLASLQFLDAVFICTSGTSTLLMPAVANGG